MSVVRKLTYLTADNIADRLRIARACMHVRHGRLFVPRDGIEPPTRGFSVLGKTSGIKKAGSK